MHVKAANVEAGDARLAFAWWWVDAFLFHGFVNSQLIFE